MIRILIVDDHPVVREGLIAVLGDEPDLEITGAAGSAEEASMLIEQVRPDVVLLDLELPGLNGVEAIPGFLQIRPETKILVFTAYDTDDRVFGAMRAGARGYLLKGGSARQVAEAVRLVHDGESFLEPRVAAKLVAQASARRPFAAILTERERAVLRFVAAGQSNKQIGRSLSITERTVKFHVTSIMRKLEADNRAQAVSVALQRGIL